MKLTLTSWLCHSLLGRKGRAWIWQVHRCYYGFFNGFSTSNHHSKYRKQSRNTSHRTSKSRTLWGIVSQNCGTQFAASSHLIKFFRVNSYFLLTLDSLQFVRYREYLNLSAETCRHPHGLWKTPRKICSAKSFHISFLYWLRYAREFWGILFWA